MNTEKFMWYVLSFSLKGPTTAVAEKSWELKEDKGLVKIQK